MKTILTINPGKKKKTKSRKTAKRKTTSKGKTMAAKRKSTAKKRTTSVTKKRKSYKTNPSRSRRLAKGAKTILSGLQLQRTLVDTTKGIGGALAAQYFAKRFADNGGANEADWTYKNYLLALAGAFAAGIGAEMFSRGSGREFLKGGLTLTGYKLITNEISQKSEFVNEYFGEDLPSYMGQDDEEVYLLGADNNYYPASEFEGELVQPGVLGGELVSPGAMGGELVAPGELGDDPYMRMMGK